eukprot:scaffold244468_cov28-Prasinocladus_malaysianus.AAC.1
MKHEVWHKVGYNMRVMIAKLPMLCLRDSLYDAKDIRRQTEAHRLQFLGRETQHVILAHCRLESSCMQLPEHGLTMNAKDEPKYE